MRPRKYVIIPVEILDNADLSPSEIYLIAQILRRQSEFETFTVADLKTVLKLSENTIRYGMLKLTECGYLSKGEAKGTWMLNKDEIDASEPQNLILNTSKSDAQSLKICGEEKEEERSKEEDKELSQIDSSYIYNNIKENDKEREIQKREKAKTADEKPKRSRPPFVKPTVEEVRAYCRERQNTVRAEAFVNFYESKGWMVGKSPMKDWKAAVRTWEQKDRESGRFYVPPENRQGAEDDLPY